jgi:hypothetical protein
VTQQKLNRPKIQAARQPAASGLVPQVVPVQIDLRELLAIDPPARPRSRRLDAVSEQNKRLPSGADCALVHAGRCAEGESVGAKESAPFQELRKPTPRLKWNAP